MSYIKKEEWTILPGEAPLLYAGTVPAAGKAVYSEAAEISG